MPGMPKTKTQPADLAELLVRCRADKNLTLEHVAKATRLSTMTISYIEARTKAPRRTTRFRIEEFLRKHGYLPKEGKAA